MQGQHFDAMMFDPTQGGGPQHPIGPKFPGGITATGIKPTSKGDGQYLEITLTSQAGTITDRLNLWNNNPQAVDIAQRKLSAYCYCVGVFKLDMANQGRELLNKPLQFEVRAQKDQPNYVEVGKVFDMQGNEPGKQGGGQQQPQQQQLQSFQQPQPQPQPNNPNWQQPQNQQPQPQPQQSWNPNPAQQQPQSQPQPQPQPQQPWQPNTSGNGPGNGTQSAPWSK